MIFSKFIVRLMLLPLFLTLLLLAAWPTPTLSSFLTCDNWFEREVLCDSIDIQKERSMLSGKKDLTYCPDKCQICRNYDQLDENRTSFGPVHYANDNGNNSNCTSYGYDGYCYDDEEDYFLNQYMYYSDENGDILSDEEGYPFSFMPWEMQAFYETAHCARYSDKVKNIWKTGDNNRMYEKIVRDFPKYSPKVLSRPEDSDYAREADDHDTSVGVGPWVVQLEDFFTDEECDEMIVQMKIAIDQGEYYVNADDKEEEEGSACQSSQAWCDPESCMEKPVLKGAWKKVEELVGLPFDTHTELVHFIQYVPGQKYGSHTDAIPEEQDSVGGPRIFTLLFYLNDIEDGNGGETCFPQIERADLETRDEPLCIRPKKGRAVIWPNILDELPDGRIETLENRTWHEANGIEEGYKFAGTIWYHLRDYSYAADIDCLDYYNNAEFNEEYYVEKNGVSYAEGGTDQNYDDDSYDENGNFYDENNNYDNDDDDINYDEEYEEEYKEEYDEEYDNDDDETENFVPKYDDDDDINYDEEYEEEYDEEYDNDNDDDDDETETKS